MIRKLQNLLLKILELIGKARPAGYSKSNSNNILLTQDKRIFISTQNGKIECDIIQLENKKAMTAKDTLNGYNFSSKCLVK